jgi:hypothetical protein
MTAPTTIIPRWEWRCFAPALKALADRAAASGAGAPRESDEIYLLDLERTENAKIRDGVLDIKRLRDVDADGLQLWEPVFKAAFPLRRSDLEAAFAAWGLHAAATGDTYALDEFLADVIAPRPDFRIARVHKARSGFTFAGCIAEFVRLTVDGIALESFSLEQEERTRIVAALAQLGLDGHANTSYPAGLKRALGIETAA